MAQPAIYEVTFIFTVPLKLDPNLYLLGLKTDPLLPVGAL